MKTLMQIVTGVPAILSLVAGIVEMFKGNDKAFAIAFVIGMILTVFFLRVSRIGNTDPRASAFAKKFF